MRVVFMGTPTLAAEVLAGLADNHEIVGVFTRPDAIRGRGKKLVASPVKQLAERLSLPVHTPETLRDAAVQEGIRALNPDVICVAAYGAILPVEVLEIPRFGCLNVHTSLLPRWRGAAPMQRSIMAQDENAGVCIMRMEEGLDTGPYCRRVEIPLDEMYLDDLQSVLAQAGTEALLDALAQLSDHPLEWIEQGEDQMCYAAKIEKGELDLDVTDTAVEACAKVRASDSAHPAHARVADRSVTVERACPVKEDDDALSLIEDLEEGQAVFRAKRFFLMTRDGAVELQTVKPEGKKSMDARSFAAGIQGIKNTTVTWGRA